MKQINNDQINKLINKLEGGEGVGGSYAAAWT